MQDFRARCRFKSHCGPIGDQVGSVVVCTAAVDLKVRGSSLAHVGSRIEGFLGMCPLSFNVKCLKLEV